MEFSEYKKFLKIDDDDDDEFLKLTYDAAVEYISSAVSNVDKNCARYKILLTCIGNEMYKNRSFSVDNISQKRREIISGMLLQLELGGE